MNKVLASLLMIGVVAAMVGAGTFAQFSDIETSTGNTITAGQIELTVNDEEPLDSAVVTITDIKPCWSELWVKNINVTNNPGNLTMRLYDIENTTGVADYPENSLIQVTNEPEYVAEGAVYANGAWDNSSWNAVDDVSAKITCTMTLYVDSGDGIYTDGSEGTGTVLFTGKTLDEIQDMGEFIILQFTDPTKTYWLTQDFHLVYEAGNEYQGDECTFSEDFMVHQHGDQTSTPRGYLG